MLEAAGRNRVALVAIAVALAAGLVTWVALGDGDGGPTPATAVGTASAPRTPAGSGTRPRLVSVAGLRAAARAAGRPLYWVGPPRRGERLELTRTRDGAYVRYLRRGMVAGDRAGALTIGSYPLDDAFADTRRSAEQAGARVTRLKGGGLAVVARGRPRNVHLAYPGSRVQVEVYDPRPGRALALVRRGVVVRVGGAGAARAR